ncbi:MAG: GNAT family N-acetyltransferase [Candidatus Eisenbacteria bacterium]|uniref:GNAT family N-acetyltransferase n=1 Tax=Eiseniibacteriota bacterium TaxID=2212470 RepID=A0A933SE36_UNCEI|nr:GNAT family N-acetyltransferase [Candidatus Eisenbacteria bacterium]
MTVLATDRLEARELTLDDAPFVHALVNDPDWIRFIGPRDAATVDAARAYLERAYLPLYAKRGLGLWAVSRRGETELIGVCSLLKRETLPDPDLGFAFLPQGRGQGYAREVAAACLAYAHGALGHPRVVAICSPGNTASCRVLEDVGMRFEKLVRLSEAGEELCLYASGEAAGA